MNQHNFFEGRSIVIATKHKKQNAMAALLEKELGVSCIVPENLDTDMLGTFSGEIERDLSPLDAARKKCLLAMELTGTDLAVASEGSFGAGLGHFLCLGVAQPAFRNRKRHLAVTRAALLAKQDRSHAHVVGALLGHKDRRMAVGTIQPFGMRLVRVNHVRHRPLHFAHDIQVHQHRFHLRIVLVGTWLNLLFQD